MTITAAADGSALGNPGPAGWAWYVDDSCWAAGGWPHGTNNMGELMAVLDLFRATEHVKDEHLRVLCDSQYVINAVTKWMPGWKRKGWRKADGKPVLNVELLKDIDAAIAGRDYSFEWVKGHAGHGLNEAADVRARAAATAYQRGSRVDAGPGFPGAERSAAPAASTGQDTLFAAFEDPAETGTGSADVDAVVALERALLDPQVRAEVGELSYLLHPAFREIGSGGAWRERDAVIALLVEQAGQEAGAGRHAPWRFELLEAAPIGPDAVHVAYRLVGPGAATAVGSLWQRDAGRWRLRLRQETPET
ncbi:ribonuclease HI family protein [Zafaria sp. Z1313]|uniref:ribonuclease HI family protein n=1 Tax=unclassified Zafaria TaxID=2828765 RepID=UPI002E77AAFF|nr:ribonuclease HI family protein [Zafaria sp. J156]MEE1622796.1 ribonuclease HI family protein [Zafaria sp. J156]